VPGFRLAHPSHPFVAPVAAAMTHQVLARKWRPRDFESLVGQDHVVRALSHALQTGRLHHAYLFTGTRGVGKTTVARILAKALNCETGVSARPCGRCAACTGIDAGRFVDCIELDAASNRGVDEMTQLLENAVYAPTAGRYKVYVIDEVHMLSAHAFNAMLKTLEEPPPHVVFVLATTDPQRVPVTVLSRCLQFNLRNMSPAAVAEHLASVLSAEGVAFDRGALDRIGRAAAGSMRDALSLLDQAIACGGGEVREPAVREMLGVVDAAWLVGILDALVARDGRLLVALADDMLAGNAPFERMLADLAALLQRIALAQVGAIADAGNPETLQRLAAAIAPEDLQVWYQIVIHGARDLPLAPDAHAGFTMVLLRLLAFGPDVGGSAGAARSSAAGPAQGCPEAARSGSARPGQAPRADACGASSSAAPAGRTSAMRFDGDWPGLAARLQVAGLVQQFMHQSELIEVDGLRFRLRVPIRALAEPGTVKRVRAALGAHFGAPVRLDVEVGRVGQDTVAAASARGRVERQVQAQAAIDADPFVRTLIEDFDGSIVPGSVRPIERRDAISGDDA